MNFNTAHATNIQLLFFAIVIVGLWHAELMFNAEPLKKKWKHTRLNLLFIITAVMIQLPLTLLLVKVMGWTESNQWGLIYFVPFNAHFMVRLVVGILLLDFFEYLYHVLMHRTKYLWHFHLIHHSDKKLDVSTTVREHPAETFIRVMMMIFVMYITGITLPILIIRQFVQSLFNISSHTSFSPPRKLEKLLGLIFITPGLHSVHHHYKLPYTDRNYGDILCIWDRLFGTYARLDDAKIIYGLDVTNHLQLTKFNTLLIYPFKLKKADSSALKNKNSSMIKNLSAKV